MTEKKATKKEMFKRIIELATKAEDTEVVEFAEHEIELLAKRKSSDSKAKAKKAAENAEVAGQILDVLAGTNKAMATLEIATAVGISTQKATPILKDLVNNCQISYAEEKKKKLYFIATDVKDETEVDIEDETEVDVEDEAEVDEVE